MNMLWYDAPAKNWYEALPLGNGRLGAMADGNPFDCCFQLNEESLVYGGPQNRNNPDAAKYLPVIRRLMKEGKTDEAEELEIYALSGIPNSQRTYQTMGNFSFHLKHGTESISNYRRQLDLNRAVASVSYTLGNTHYEINAFISLADDLLAIELKGSEKGSLSLSASLSRGHFYHSAGKAEHDRIFFGGDLGKGGSEFQIQVKAVSDGGTVQVIGEHLVIQNAEHVCFYLNGVTTFPYRRNKVQNCNTYLSNQLKGLTTESFSVLMEQHIRKYQEMFCRSVLKLEDSDTLSHLPMDQRLKRLSEGKTDPGMEALYYAFGRYLLISCSQPGGLPANLQGIWCDSMAPLCDSKYTININTQMNYWPAEICNLSECHEPLFDLLERMVSNGRKTAREMYGCRGFVAHHNTDIWADTAPQDAVVTATYWFLGGAWLATHIWKHYRYTLDRNFLKRMFPVIKESVQFFLDFLIEDQSEFVICPSISPENTYLLENGSPARACMGCTMDTAILKDLFSQYLACAELLGDEENFQEQVRCYMDQFPKYQIGKYGQLMEWRKDYEEWEIGHRHFSHLYPLFPSNQINEYENPELITACRNSLERRMQHGGGYTGWSCAWLINLYARMQDGNMAEHYLKVLLGNITSINLFDLHPLKRDFEGFPWIFQIDGNLGGICGIAQLLLQSHLDEIFLLPALPDVWKRGSITGLCAEGGFSLDISWEAHRLKEAVLYSRAGQKAVIRSKEPLKFMSSGHEVDFSIDKKGRYVFDTQKGGIYTLTPTH